MVADAGFLEGEQRSRWRPVVLLVRSEIPPSDLFTPLLNNESPLKERLVTLTEDHVLPFFL